MQPMFIISATLALILIPVAFFLYASLRNAQRKGKHLEIQLATASSQLAGMNRDSEELKSIRLTNSRYLEEKSVAVTEKKSLEQKLETVSAERDAFLKEKEEAVATRQEALKNIELMQQKMNDAQTRMKDWETQRDEAHRQQ